MLTQQQQEKLYLKYERESNKLGIKFEDAVKVWTVQELIANYRSEIETLILSYSDELKLGVAPVVATMFAERNKNYNAVPQLIKAFSNNEYGRIRSIVQGEAIIYTKGTPLYTGIEASKEPDVVMWKKWVHGTPMGDPRENHVAEEGTKIKVEDKFTVSGQKVLAPGQFGDPKEDRFCTCFLVLTDF